MSIYLHSVQAIERQWRRPCCHDGGDCDDVDGFYVGDDSDCHDGGGGAIEKIVVAAVDVASDVVVDASDVNGRDCDSDDDDDGDDGDGGDGGDDDDDGTADDETGNNNVDDDDDDDDDGGVMVAMLTMTGVRCALIVCRLSPWYRSCGFRQGCEGSLVKFRGL